MNDKKLAQLLDDSESDRSERKTSLSDPKEIRQAICAFANDMPNHKQPGVIFIGAKDDGTPSNLPITDYRNRFLAEAMRNLGYVQQFGVGIQIARRQLERNGNPPPGFTLEETYTLVTLRRFP